MRQRVSPILKSTIAASIAILISLALATEPRQISADNRPTAEPFEPVAQQAFHNAHRVTDKVISGDQPEGDAAFTALEKLGVKTIISVDGATPDAEAARRHGMRYIHIPIGYDGVTVSEGKAIAKAIDEMPGLIYLHCHHGQHRSAAATTVACVYNGSLKPEEAESVLKVFGTGENYKGLWKAALEARRVNPVKLATLDVKFVEVSPIPELAEAMVHLDQRWDRIVLLQKSNWQPVVKDHPDLDPPHEALQAQEQIHEIGRTDAVQSRPADFRKMLAQSEARVSALRDVLAAQPLQRDAADAAFKKASASCLECHAVYRD